MEFSDRLAALVEERRSQLVLGLDPDPAKLWPCAIEVESPPADVGFDARAATPVEAGERASSPGPRLADLLMLASGRPTSAHTAARTALSVARHCRAAIEAAGAACVAVKLQLACFERLGGPGWLALSDAVAVAREHGLLVIADGKRGDVPVSAHAYAQALVGETAGPYGPVAGLGADAFTVNPLLGADSLEPFVAAADSAGAGCFVLVRTSNRGAADFQDLEAGGAPLHERFARLVDTVGTRALGDCGLASVGAVIGATAAGQIGRLRELMPHAIFLLPGVGTQGGRVAELRPAFAPHPAAGLIAASRSIVDAHLARRGDPAAAAASAAEELRASGWALGN